MSANNSAKNKEGNVKKKTRRIRRLILALIDCLAIVVLALISYWMVNWGIYYKPKLPGVVIYWVIGNVAAALILFFLFRLYFMEFATAGIIDSIRILGAVLVLLGLNVLFVYFAIDRHQYHLGVPVVIVYCLMLFLTLLTLRFSKRIVSSLLYLLHKNKKGKKRVMIVGAGDAGAALMRQIISDESELYNPVCMVDDDPEMQGETVYNVRVEGTTEQIVDLAQKYSIDEIFIATPSADRRTQRQIIERCQKSGCFVKILPELFRWSDSVSVSNLRRVEIQDLLGRDQINVDIDELIGYIQNKTVLVTGGGGSIGSELCRQIAAHGPKRLIILDIYENNAYEIEQELKRNFPELDLLTLIASIRDENKMRDVFKKYRPQIVFNAAAHKHVPLMETSPNEAVKNNVFGTLNVAKAADEFNAETFIQISTDKAVNPTNIMGATKRICEMIVQTIGKYSKTRFVAVRFGNVLGSNGSVIPLFEKQIENGGPVTVTHKDIIRYFMTISEAVSLVLQAGAYAKGGQIFVLDMGEPVKIYDLACNLIKLSGFEPNVDIEIKCTGLRPGEKLYEERLMAEEGLQKTPNGLINIAKPIPLNEDELWMLLDKLYAAAYSETDDMKEWVQKLVPTYTIDTGHYEPTQEETEKIKALAKNV